MQAQLDGIMQQGQQLEAQQQKLIEGERTLQTKVESFRTQKEVIKAQYSAAEAQVRIGEAATGIGEQMADVGLAIQRAKDKTEQMQARGERDRRADGLGRARGLHRRRATTSTASSRRSRSRRQVDDELAKMKAELGQGDAPPKELAGGEPRTPARERGADHAVIVRLMGEGQWRVDDALAARLNELDEEVATGGRRKATRRRSGAGCRRSPTRCGRTARSSPTTISRRPTRSSRRRTCRSRRHASCSTGEGLIPDLRCA